MTDTAIPEASGRPLDRPTTEQRYATDVVAFAVPRDLVVVDGPEAAVYHHGQMSQDIEGMGEGEWRWTLLLEPQGRIAAWGRVGRVGPETFWFLVDPGHGPAAEERLARFKLRTKLDLATESIEMVAIRGPEAPSLDAVADLLPSGRVALAPAWPGLDGVDVVGVGPSSDVAAALDLVAFGDPAVFEAARIRAGQPAMGAELGEKTIPAEAGIVGRSADFTKGCYVGQELVARVDSRGSNTPRRVHPVAIAGSELPDVGTSLTIDGDDVGTITSRAPAGDGVVALASIRRGTDVPARATIEIDGSPIEADIGDITWDAAVAP